MSSACRSSNPLAPHCAPSRHSPLIARLVTREIIDRYRGSFVGGFPSFSNPLLRLATYFLVLRKLFHSHWTELGAGHGNFAVVFFRH